MKKAIAMKCTQKQFDAIRDKLVGIEIGDDIAHFKNYPYLVNNYAGKGLNFMSNASGYYNGSYNREIHETWNEEIFLNACGIETEKIFKGSELQLLSNFSDTWLDCDNLYQFRLKPANLIKKQELESQILELQNQLKQL